MNRSKIYLVCYAVRVGSMDSKDLDFKRNSVASTLQTNSKKFGSTISENGNQQETVRRPFGIAARDVTPLIKNPDDFKNNLDLPFVL